MTISALAVQAASSDQATQLRSLAAHAGLALEGLDDAWKTWVATSGGAVVGGVALERNTGAGQSVFLLRTLVVDGTHRGQGVGARLVAAALGAADRDSGPKAQVALLTQTADSYFPRFGFTAVARATLPAALARSAELTGPCPDTARAFVRV